MDLATIAGAAVGGAIGLLGDLTGRLGARRQAARQRLEFQEDSQIAYDRAILAEELRLRRERSYAAAENILKSFLENPANLVQHDEAVKESALSISATLYFESNYLTDNELRRRLQISSDVLDVKLSGSPVGSFSLAEIIFIVRYNCNVWLGNWIRAENVVDPNSDWLALKQELIVALDLRHAELLNQGFNVHPRKVHEI